MQQLGELLVVRHRLFKAVGVPVAMRGGRIGRTVVEKGIGTILSPSHVRHRPIFNLHPPTATGEPHHPPHPIPAQNPTFSPKFRPMSHRLLFFLLLLGTACADDHHPGADEQSLAPQYRSDFRPNLIFVLADDHRYDFMGFTGKVPWLETPHLDRLAAEGAYSSNTFVGTSLCSPSRASILTGLYTHTHTVVDNGAPAPPDLTYFPQLLQRHGYKTGYFGKWHMGRASDDPRPGFDEWVSFKGQGTYYAPNLNVNGRRIQYPDTAYTPDLLTDHALNWMREVERSGEPFFAYVSHKAVHAEFAPAKRHLGRYDNEEIIYPPSYRTSAEQVAGKRTSANEPYTREQYYGDRRQPDWQRMQRESWHGVDYMYHGALDFETFYRRYCETLLGVDDNVGRLLNFLDERGIADETVVIYMGDNGFSFGEHGLIDKRHFYEESAKVPFLARYPKEIEAGSRPEAMLMNVDIAPSFLDYAGADIPESMQGRSFRSVLNGKVPADWRDRVFYEYYWENDFPQTPTTFGVRTDRYKYIRYHGIWDTNEFYDLENDPDEMRNLIAEPAYQDTIARMSAQLFDWLEETEGMNIPLKRLPRPRWGDHRNKDLY